MGGRRVFPRFSFYFVKFPRADRDVDSARRSMKWRAEFFTVDVIPRTNRNDSISARKMIQGIRVALFLSACFPVCLLPNSAGNKDCCDFVTCYFMLPLKVSLFHIFLISLDRVEPFVRMVSNEKKRKNKKETPNDEKPVINKWSREDSGMLIDMVKKNPVIWNTKSCTKAF